MYKKCDEILNKLESEGKIKMSDYQFPPKQELKLKLKDMLESEVDEKYYLSDKQLTYVLDMRDVALSSGRNINERIVNPQIAKTISCRGAADQRADVTNFTIDGCDEKIKVKDVKLRIKEATKQGYKEAFEGNGIDISSRMKYHRGNVQKDMIQTITTSGGNDRGVCVGTYQYAKSDKFMNGKDRLQLGKDVSDTLQTTPKEGVCYNDLRIRKLTPKECWRLMGFDDEDFEKASQVNSNTQLYKQAGNSIVVNVLMSIFKELIK